MVELNRIHFRDRRKTGDDAKDRYLAAYSYIRANWREYPRNVKGYLDGYLDAFGEDNPAAHAATTYSQIEHWSNTLYTTDTTTREFYAHYGSQSRDVIRWQYLLAKGKLP